LKIIYCSDAGLPGKMANTVHVMKMCQAFAKNGNKVTLIAHKNGETFISVEDLYKTYSVENNFDIYFAPYPQKKGGGYTYTWNALKFIRKYKPDIVYGRSMYSCTLSAMLLHQPTVFEIHGETKRRGKYGFLFSKFIRSKYFLRLVVISEALSQYYQKEWGLPKEKIFVAHDGADLLDTSKINEVGICPENRNIGYFGSLFKGKGMELITKIARAMPDYNFHIFGGKPKEIDYWKTETEDLNNIRFYGYVNQELVASYAREMDVLVAPYQENVFTSIDKKTEDISKYMSPLKIFEYMSFEKPMVCSDLPVIREVLSNGEDSILCPSDDVDKWCDSIKRLCFDDDLSGKLAINARKKLESKYTWDIRSRRVIERIDL